MSGTEKSVVDSQETQPRDSAVLVREAQLKPPRRSGLAWMAAGCTLAGVLFGFGLRTMSQQCDRNAATISAVRSGDTTWLGVQVRSPCNQSQDGALVLSVFPNSPAATAGLERGDLIVELRDRDVSSASDLVREVRALRPGTAAEIQIRRGGVTKTLRTRLGIMPTELAQ